MRCVHCGAELPSGGKFCPHCGQRLEEMRPCARCGAALRADDRFCARCGAPVTGEAPAETGEALTLPSEPNEYGFRLGQIAVPLPSADVAGRTESAPPQPEEEPLTPPAEPAEYGFKRGQIDLSQTAGPKAADPKPRKDRLPERAPSAPVPYPAALRSEHTEPSRTLNVPGLVGMVFGIIALLISWTRIAPLVGIAAAVISGVSLSERRESRGREPALVGLTLGLAVVFQALRNLILF